MNKIICQNCNAKVDVDESCDGVCLCCIKEAEQDISDIEEASRGQY